MIDDEAKKVLHEAADAFGVKAKHEKRLIASLNVLTWVASIYRWFKDRKKQAADNDE